MMPQKESVSSVPSTSAGSSPFVSSEPEGMQFTYPVPLFVQNTFIEAPLGRPSSLEGFLEERQTLSCPASRAPSGSGCEALWPPEATSLGSKKVPYCPGAQLMKSAAFGSKAPLAVLPVRPPREQSGDKAEAAAAARMVARKGDQKGDAGLTLLGRVSSPVEGVEDKAATATRSPALAAPGPEVASAVAAGELPSVGSEGHFEGRCKPCAFFHTKGCASGSDCSFCHLCEAGEKQRRQKEKRVFFGTMRQLQKMASEKLQLGQGAQKQEKQPLA